MSQPLGIIAKIKISEIGFKSFLKKEATFLAKEVFESFWNKNEAIFIFHYTKRTSCLYCFVYFNHGNSEMLKASQFYKSLVNIEPFLDADSEGYFLTSLDSLNVSDFITENAIKNKKWTPYSFSDKELKLIKNEAAKNFFTKIEDVSDYSKVVLDQPNFLYKAIKNQFLKLQEIARINTIKNDLSSATAINPIQIFKHYFFNGHHFYYCDGNKNITTFENINLQLLEENTYGLHDDKHIIVLDKCIEEDPKTFKKLHRAYTTYYKSATTVYDKYLQPIENADPKSFKLVEAYLATDINYLYLHNHKILKEDLGEYYFDNAIFYSDKLIIGKKQIWLSDELLETIDAATFELIDFEPNKKFEDAKKRLFDHHIGETIKQGKDKHGEFFIFKAKIPNVCFKEMNLTKEYGAIVLRKTYNEFVDWFENLINETVSFYKISETSFYRFFDKQQTADGFKLFNEWIENYFDSQYEDVKYSSYFLQGTNNYLYDCWQEFEKSGKTNYSSLEQGLAFYSKIKQDFIANLNPHIFHHLCCFCVALNRFEEAVTYFQKAFYFGYLDFDLMTSDNDLAPIFDNPKVKEIKNWFKQNVIYPKTNGNWRWEPNPNPFPRINDLQMDLLEQLPEELKQGNRHQVDYLGYLMKNGNIWDISYEKDDDSLVYNKMIMRFEPYFNLYLQKNIDLSWQEHCAYIYYQEYSITNAKSHLVRLEFLFYNAHNEFGVNEMNEENVSNLIHRIQLKYKNASEEDKKYIDKSKVLEWLK